MTIEKALASPPVRPACQLKWPWREFWVQKFRSVQDGKGSGLPTEPSRFS